MTVTVKLVQRDDFTADISDLDLNGFADGIGLSSWTSGQFQEETGRIFEDMNLGIKGSSVNDLASNQQALANMLRLVGQSKSAAERYGIWLRAQLDGESKARQAYITNVKQGQITSPISKLVRRKFISESALTFERMPCWEDTGDLHLIQGSACSGIGGIYTPYQTAPGDAIIYGDHFARIGMATIQSGGAYALTKFWLGLRSTQYGTLANFVPVWNLHKAGILGTDTSFVHPDVTYDDATAKDGHKVICTFATDATLVSRVLISVNNAVGGGGSIVDQRGTFKVLLRAKNSAAGTTRVRLYEKLLSSTMPAYKSRVPIASTAWQFYDLGNVTLPSSGNLVYGADPILQSCLGIDAERVSGACSLDMDCFVLIPYDEGFIYIPDGYAYTTVPVTDADYTIAVERPDGAKKAYTTDQDIVSTTLSTPYFTGGYPLGANPIVVVAAQRATSSDIDDGVYTAFRLYQRWDQLRGNE